MFADRRGLLLVVALVLVLGAVVWTNFGGSSPAGPAAAAAGRTRRPAQGSAAEPLPAAEAVRLEALPQGRGEPEPAQRNPFRFERRQTGTRPAEVAAPVAPPPVAPAPVVPTGPPPPPPIPLKFIGVVGQAGGTSWAVLSQGDGRAPLYGKEGDTIDGRYRILKIGTESIEMAYLDGRGRQTIKLTGQ